MDKKKIAFIVFEPHFSGQGRAVRDIVKNIQDDYDVFLVCQKSNEILSGLLDPDKTLACTLSKTLNFDFIKAVKFLRREKIDLIHLHGFEGLIWGHMVSLFVRKPIVFTPHTIDMHNQVIYFFFKFAWMFFTYLKTSKLITVSHNDKKILAKRKMTPRSKIEPIYLAVDKERYKGVASKKASVSGIPDNKFIVLQVGHISVQKNPLCYFRAAQILSAKYKDIVFVHAGSGPMKEDVEKFIKDNGLTENAVLLGQRSDIFEVMGRADIIVNSSEWEGLPFTIVDAAHLGKPTVVSSVNGNVDIIKDSKTGMVFNKGDFNELSLKIEKLYLDQLFAENLGNELKKSIADKFEYDVMLEKHKLLYQELIG